ncbi:MAG: hypothetical protein IK115_00140 [Lachnospiraceae bacterium]|nr:hypothetical protein [Lachnospiraceae bacterium]
MNKYAAGFPALLILLCLLPTLFFMKLDSYRTGDEIVSYGMANEPEQGWMFSKGKIRTYMEEDILRDGVMGIPANLFAAVKDVLANRRDAEFFRMERPEESGWYSGAEFKDYLKITEGEAFRPGDIYLNAMGDDANSFLYYSCLHFVSSAFPGISDTKWSGFILNLLCMAACLYLLYLISGYLIGNKAARFISVAAYACSSGAVGMFTNIRPYALAAVLQEALLLLHLHMLKTLEEQGQTVARKDFKWLALLYILGFTAHYTTGIWALCLAAYTLCRAFRNRSFIRSYLLTGILAVFLGLCVDPMSVLGLLSKQSVTESDSLLRSFAELWRILVRDVCGDKLFLLIQGLLLLAALGRFLMSEKRSFDKKSLLFTALPLSYMLLSTLLMHVVKISTMIPLVFLLLAISADYAFGEGSRWKNALLAAVLLIWFGGTMAGLVEDKKNERAVNLMLEEEMALYPSDTMVFVRDHGCGYDKIPLLSNYRRLYLLTTDEGWEGRKEEMLSAAGQSGLILFDGSGETVSAVESWLSEAGYGTEVLFGDAQCTLLKLKELKADER